MTRWHLAFAAFCVFCTGAVAQQNAPIATPPTHQHTVVDSPRIDGKDHPRVLAPHKPVMPRAAKPEPSGAPIPRSMVGGFWMEGPDLRSSIHLSNDVITDPITVTPILHISTGRKLALPKVKLAPSGIAVISIDDALKQANLLPTKLMYGYVECSIRGLGTRFVPASRT